MEEENIADHESYIQSQCKHEWEKLPDWVNPNYTHFCTVCRKFEWEPNGREQ